LFKGQLFHWEIVFFFEQYNDVYFFVWYADNILRKYTVFYLTAAFTPRNIVQTSIKVKSYCLSYE